jgi:hypothetical protein
MRTKAVLLSASIVLFMMTATGIRGDHLLPDKFALGRSRASSQHGPQPEKSVGHVF